MVVDLQNVCWCVEQDVEKVYKFVLEKFVGDLLVVVDIFECGLEMFDFNDEVIKLMCEGMELILKMFDDILCCYQVEVLNLEGEFFNFEQYQVMVMQESVLVELGSVFKVFQKGYLFNGCLLCLVMVVVSKVLVEILFFIDEQV